jgi:hypothetical protein
MRLEFAQELGCPGAPGAEAYGDVQALEQAPRWSEGMLSLLHMLAEDEFRQAKERDRSSDKDR